MICKSVKVVLNNFLFIDATDKSKISSDQKQLFFAVCLLNRSFEGIPTKYRGFEGITTKYRGLEGKPTK